MFEVFVFLAMTNKLNDAEDHKVRVLTRSKSKARVVFPGKKVMINFLLELFTINLNSITKCDNKGLHSIKKHKKERIKKRDERTKLSFQELGFATMHSIGNIRTTILNFILKYPNVKLPISNPSAICNLGIFPMFLSDIIKGYLYRLWQ